jgi:flagellar biosynthesis protein FliR
LIESLLDSAFGISAPRHLGGLALISARVVPSIVVLPAFGAPALPFMLRLVMGFSVSVWLSFALPILNLPDVSWLLWLTLARELAVGFALAWLGFLVFRAVGMAGEIVDVFRRSQPEDQLETEMGAAVSSSATSMLWGLLAVLLFAELGGLTHTVSALARSYEVLPLFQNIPRVLPTSLVSFVGSLVGGVFEAAVGLAAPVLIAIWLSELAISVVLRIVSRNGTGGESVVRLSSPMVGLAMLLISLGVVRAGIEGWIIQVPGLVIRVVRLWGH